MEKPPGSCVSVQRLSVAAFRAEELLKGEREADEGNGDIGALRILQPAPLESER
jgi:hypothetical protein